MQYKFFSIPAVDCDVRSFEDLLNGFLRGHRILSVKRELLCDGPQSRWCVCVEYLDGLGGEMPERDNWPRKERIDYREILSEEEFARFAKMRSARKALAEADHIPAYAIMKDEQMAELAKKTTIDEWSLRGLSGFGEKKFEKYGMRFLAALQEKANETCGESVSENQHT